MIHFWNKVKYCKTSPFLQASCGISKLNMSLSMTDVNPEINSLKRESSEQASELQDEPSAKKPLLENEKPERIKRKKVAMLIAYLGQGYLGLQRNPGMKTIEEDLLVAMLNAGYIGTELFEQPQIMQFQRAARTDKGVSAIRQVLSLKFDEKGTVEAINKYLPEQIRAIAIQRVTRGFNSKSNCDARTYSYMTPTFAFAPQGQEIFENYRLPSEVHQRVGEVLKMYQGTHNYHNFTSKRLPSDPSSKRYIMSFTCGEPFVKDDLEFVIMKVKGQSFMLHQIRKMVGLAIAIVRGLTTADTLIKSREREKLDIPIAPGLGLLLEEVHYDRYNKRYGSDGLHEPIDWSKWNEQVEEFKEKFILPTIINTEKNEKSMLNWLESLSLHSFSVRTEHIHSELDKAVERNQDLLTPPSKVDVLLSAVEATR